MSEEPVPRKILPVACELAEWEERAKEGDEVAQRAIGENPDPAAIAILRHEFAEGRKASY